MNEITKQVRKRQFNWLDFFSYVGGILGLFAGFSALSFVEIIYWFTIRVMIKKISRKDTRVYPLMTAEGSNIKCLKFIEFLQSFLSESSIHGMWHIHEFSLISGYVIARDLNTFEIFIAIFLCLYRLTWIFCFATSMVLCFHLILSTQASAPNSRVIAFDDNYKLVKDVGYSSDKH